MTRIISEDDLQAIYAQRDRLSQIISAMQRKQDVWWRAWGFFWRKPWRAPGPMLPPRGHRHLLNVVRSVAGWLRRAHDCQDPAVGCSCYPSFRMPKVD